MEENAIAVEGHPEHSDLGVLASLREAQIDASVVVRGLSVVAPGGKLLLRDVSFALPAGSLTAVIGPSGCGKSTLLRVLAGMQPVAAGGAWLASLPAAVIRESMPSAVGYLPQFAAAHPELTVREILRFAAALRLPGSMDRKSRDAWLRNVAELAGAERLLDQRYRTLSGGQLRRVALAEELVGDPEFLLLDELTSGLDVRAEEEITGRLRELAHAHGKTVVMVTHSLQHIEDCDQVILLNEGRVGYAGPPDRMLGHLGAEDVRSVFWMVAQGGAGGVDHVLANVATDDGDRVVTDAAGGAAVHAVGSVTTMGVTSTPGGWAQWPVLVRRQFLLLLRDRGQLVLHAVLMFSFPVLVAVFASDGLPQVRSLSLELESNPLVGLSEQLLYLKESFSTASLVSGLSMFQVILLCLIGANNGAREIAKERAIVEKESRVGLSPWAYLLSKFLFVGVFCVAQAFWMTWFVKAVCGFPGDFGPQFAALLATTLAMSATCLAISAGCRSPERASLLAIYLVGLQLPLSGAVLALPEVLSWVTRPFIAAYWGWSGYLKCLTDFRHYDIVREATDTFIAPWDVSLAVLALHVMAAFVGGWWFLERQRG